MNKIITALLIAFSFASNSQLYTPGSGVTDIDGNNYQSIIINGQEWMSENLRTTRYANGDPIPNETDGNQWVNLTTGAWALYNNDSQFEIPFGKHYNWFTVSDQRNICPIGWHTPSKEEWSFFVNSLDPFANGNANSSGGKMKSIGIQIWDAPNTGATNESGFTGLPSGSRDYQVGSFGNFGYSGWWWTSTEQGSFAALRVLLDCVSIDANIGDIGKRAGLSVRCLKNSTSGINEIKPTFKTLIRITDIMGRETVFKNNEVLFYLYSDGSVEKKVISE